MYIYRFNLEQHNKKIFFVKSRDKNFIGIFLRFSYDFMYHNELPDELMKFSYFYIKLFKILQ
jgi:hypothetical protein